MAKKLYEEASVQAIANAIRAKNGSTATYKVAQMADAVLAIAPLQPDVEEYPQMSTTVAAYSGKTVAFARFGCYWIDSHSIVTVNEEIG